MDPLLERAGQAVARAELLCSATGSLIETADLQRRMLSAWRDVSALRSRARELLRGANVFDATANDHVETVYEELRALTFRR